MNLQRFVSGLLGPTRFQSTIRMGAVAAAAVAGYLTFLPASPTTGRIDAAAEQVAWTGGIEPPIETSQSYTPVTSASYLDTTVSPAASAAHKSATTPAAVQPKSADKVSQRPKRAQDDAATKTPDATASASTMGKPVEADRVIASAEALPGEEKSFSRRLLSPVADRLPSTGSLLKPLHVVGDAVHQLIKSF